MSFRRVLIKSDLQNSASIHPGTRLSKFGRCSNVFFSTRSSQVERGGLDEFFVDATALAAADGGSGVCGETVGAASEVENVCAHRPMDLRAVAGPPGSDVAAFVGQLHAKSFFLTHN